MGRLKREPPPKTYERIVVTTLMLLSVNRKYGLMINPRTRKPVEYILPSYRKAEKEGVDNLKNQLLAFNQIRTQQGEPCWLPQSTDRYTIFYSFDFTGMTKQDIHNTLKPTCDMFQKAGLIKNDNRSFQEILVKNPRISYPKATITIYKFHEAYYEPAPIEEMYQDWLAEKYPDTILERIAV